MPRSVLLQSYYRHRCPDVTVASHRLDSLRRRVRILTQKRGVGVTEVVGGVVREFWYTPLITREDACIEETHKLLNQLFRGSASLLVNLLVNSGDLSAEDLREIMEAQLAQKK